MKKHIDNFDLIRAFSALVVVVYHFACSCNVVPNFHSFPFINYANGNWGEITAVSLFFMLSGAVLYYNYPTIKLSRLRSFYISRWKSIFPMFFLVWVYYYYKNVLLTGKFFYAASPKYIILSLFGVDGYFSYLHPNFYICGEWFLGAIVLLYTMYPILLFVMNRFRIVGTIVLFVMYGYVLCTSSFQISDTRNLITCMLAFWVGMLFIRYREFVLDIRVVAVVCIVGGILLFVPLHTNTLLCMNVVSCALLLGLFRLSEFLYRVSFLKKVIQFTSRISYAIFLVQHIVITEVVSSQSAKNLGRLSEGILLIVTLILIYTFSTALYELNKSLIKITSFRKPRACFVE